MATSETTPADTENRAHLAVYHALKERGVRHVDAKSGSMIAWASRIPAHGNPSVYLDWYETTAVLRDGRWVTPIHLSDAVALVRRVVDGGEA